MTESYPDSKTCTVCKSILPLSSFNKCSATKDQKRSECKSCQRAYRHRWYEDNREREIKKAKDYVLENRESVNAKVRRRLASSEIARDKNKSRSAAWRESNPDAFRKYYQEKREYHRARSSEYKKKNPLKSRQWEASRRARSAGVSVGIVSYESIVERDGLHCYLCGKPTTENDFEFDHVIPLSKGGPHSVDNVRVTHAFCNRSKKNKNALEDKDKIPTLLK